MNLSPTSLSPLIPIVTTTFGAAAYAVLCRRVSLRTSLVAGILLTTGSTLFYLGYDSRLAALIVASIPLYVALFDRVIFGRRLSSVAVIGLVIGFTASRRTIGNHCCRMDSR